MGRFDFRSPGAAAGDAVSRYFAELEQKRRQQMMDQIAFDREGRLKEHDRVSLEAQTAQLANTKENTRSLIEEREARAALAQEQQFAKSHLPGDTVDPEAAKKFPGMVAQAPYAQGALQSVDEQDIPTYDVTGGETTFKGTPEQRTAADEKARRETYIQSLDPASPMAKHLAAQDATGDTSLPYQLSQGEQAGAPKLGTFEDYVVRAHGQNPTSEQVVAARKTWEQANDTPRPGGNTTINMGSDAVEMAAWQYLQTGTLPPLGMGASNLRQQILERAAGLAKESGGINPQANAALYGADKAALTQLNRTLTAISAFESTAQKNIVQMQTAMNGVTDTGLPFINAPLRDLQRMTGSPEVAKYQASIRVVIPELARILTQPNLAGMLTDQARHEIESVVRGDATVAQANAVIDLLLQDMTNRKAGLVAERDALMSGISQRGPAGVPGVMTPGADPVVETPALRKRYNPATRRVE